MLIKPSWCIYANTITSRQKDTLPRNFPPQYEKQYRTLAKISPSWINAHPLFSSASKLLHKGFSLEYTPTHNEEFERAQ